jgi:hypothetical protein
MYTLAQPFVCQMMCACMCECTHIRACPPAGLVCNCIHVHTLARPQMCVCMHVLMHAARAHTGTPAYRPGACVRARARSRAGAHTPSLLLVRLRAAGSPARKPAGPPASALHPARAQLFLWEPLRRGPLRQRPPREHAQCKPLVWLGSRFPVSGMRDSGEVPKS